MSGRGLRVLVACEESQAVTIELRRLGHEAYSCDIQPCSGGHPEWHLQQDVTPLLKLDWDMIIAHPPCTYLSNAGARWLWKGGRLDEERYSKGLMAREFFMAILNSKCPRVAIENPMPSAIYGLPRPSQIIQPYEFGHPYSKKTYLWLKGLPPIIPTEAPYLEHLPYVTSGTYSKTHDERYKGASRRGGSAKTRSKTFPGIARAMAEQWAGDARKEKSDGAGDETLDGE